MTPYEILGVKPDASFDEIRQAYRQLSKTAHPDVGGDHETFQRLVKAHDLLTDPERRRRYDETGDDAEPVDLNAQLNAHLVTLFQAIVGEALKTPSCDLTKIDVVHRMREAMLQRI